MNFQSANSNDINEIKSLLLKANLPIEDISENKQQFWIIKKSDVIVAVGGLEIYGDQALLRSFAVKPEYRNKGIGSELYKNMVAQGRSKGVKFFYLLTTTAAPFFLKNKWVSIDKNAVPLIIRSSSEFTSICPQSAECMILFPEEYGVDSAKGLFQLGFNCAQSVFADYAQKLGLSESMATKIATGFGAGIAYRGETCGAVTGAYMAIGMKWGQTQANDSESKSTTLQKINQFDQEFINTFGSLNCKSLLGMDVSNQNDLDSLRKNQAFSKICPVLVSHSSMILKKLES